MLFCVYFHKQKVAYEMRISDWSSDVCSSDLFPVAPQVDHGPALCRCLVESLVEGADVAFPVIGELPLRIRVMNKEGKARAVAIGRASRRERECQYVSI